MQAMIIELSDKWNATIQKNNSTTTIKVSLMAAVSRWKREKRLGVAQ
jgi:hypothetical protein